MKAHQFPEEASQWVFRHYLISLPVETKGDHVIATDAQNNEEHNDLLTHRDRFFFYFWMSVTKESGVEWAPLSRLSVKTVRGFCTRYQGRDVFPLPLTTDTQINQWLQEQLFSI